MDETEAPQWLLEMDPSMAGKCVDEAGVLATDPARVYAVVVDNGASIWPRMGLSMSGGCLASVVLPGVDPEIVLDIAVSVGDFLVLHEGHLRVASAEESLTMDVVARARETYAGPPKLVKVSVWL
jgi:hypothetical protein